MFGNITKGASAYAKVGVETGVTSASPHVLILMLYDGAIAAINSSIGAIQAGDIAKKGMLISKAIAIIDSGLRTSLDKSKGGELATNLENLYAYMSHRLLTANLHNNASELEEVRQLLQDLRHAWELIGKKAQETGSAPAGINGSMPARSIAA
ncbi:flagellar protein FliS [Noviherbaspirillum humi]|uniref:Flagellar secretion chaperone FliS n=1 Tax=Noviherbaspirillum humi TaxID=1688639 RepID=A0A239FZL6_9BURK|nr:flagellar export chaperone FliS [Noviherbaspirillum humi]SNS61732.1 flagellar protein FliS [Noviherbaspirillum humi]